MSFLLDTNIPSDQINSRPEPRVGAWMYAQPEETLFLSVVTIGELRKGIVLLPQSKRRAQLERWLESYLIPQFSGRILPVTHAVANHWGILDAQRQLTGAPLDTADGQIAATALEHDLNAGHAQREGLRQFGPHDPQSVGSLMSSALVPVVSLPALPPALPSLIAGAGERAAWRFVDFFTVNIRNQNTRAAYTRAAGRFLCWCEEHGISELRLVQPVHVALYIEELQSRMSAPKVKQHLACLRMLFEWLVTGQVVPTNPAHAVRGPRHSVSKGATAVISSAEARELLDSMDTTTVVGLRDHALVAVMTFTFARVSAVVGLKVEDYYPQKKRWWLRLREKNGKVNEMPCHHKLEAYLDAYLAASGIREDRKGPLFRAAVGRTGKIANRPLSRTDVWSMVRRRAADARIETAIGCHTFRATGITDYLTNGGRIEVAQRMAGHSNAKMTGLYDRRSDDICLSEVAKIGI